MKKNKTVNVGPVTKNYHFSLKLSIPFFFLIAIGAAIYFLWNPPGETQKNYIEKVYANTHFENTIENAVPQTEIYNIISDHFNSELPEGKTVKKAIVIGYDGCRDDVLVDIDSKSDGAINKLLKGDGKMVISYCGGVPCPQKNTQDTSTAPGWCSMLTGCLADVHGITANSIVKSNDHLTLLTTLVEDKTINSSAFYVSWKGHFVNDNSTYHAEKEYIADKKLDVTFECAKNDKGTRANMLADVKSADCSDFIFGILEYCDHAGHQTGFYGNNLRYKSAFKTADAAGEEIINAIEARETFENEDWLIVVTSDHGGIGRAHGGPSIQERYTFIVANKEF